MKTGSLLQTQPPGSRTERASVRRSREGRAAIRPHVLPLALPLPVSTPSALSLQGLRGVGQDGLYPQRFWEVSGVKGGSKVEQWFKIGSQDPGKCHRVWLSVSEGAEPRGLSQAGGRTRGWRGGREGPILHAKHTRLLLPQIRESWEARIPNPRGPWCLVPHRGRGRGRADWPVPPMGVTPNPVPFPRVWHSTVCPGQGQIFCLYSCLNML